MKIFRARVVSAKMEKTAIVVVESRRPHPLYGKMVKKTKKYKVHCEKPLKEADLVEIQECRPLSKEKRWKVIKI